MAGFSVETSPPVVVGPIQVRNNDEPPDQNRPNAETPAVIEERKSDRSTQQTVTSKLFEIYQGNAVRLLTSLCGRRKCCHAGWLIVTYCFPTKIVTKRQKI